MFSSALKTLISKPALSRSLIKTGFNPMKSSYMAATSQFSFSRNFKAQKPTHTSNAASHTTQEDFRPFEAAKPVGPNVDTLIKEDVNLNKFMSKIYKTTGLSIAGSLSLSYLAAGTALVASPMFAIFGGLAMSIGGIVGLNRIPPEIKLEKQANGELVEKWVNPFNRQLAFSAIIAGSGISLAPFMYGLIMTNPALIPMAASLSFFVMGGASVYSMYKPLGHFKAWESTLFGALIGLIGMNLLSLGATAMLGPNLFSLACGRIDMYLGLGLFAAFQAIDTQIAVQAFKDGNYDHLMHVVSFFLNFKNIFIRIASILGGFRDE